MATKSTRADSIAKAIEQLGAKLETVKVRDGEVLASILSMVDEVDEILALLGE